MTMTVYACGGAGLNIARQIKDLDIDTYFVDTSKSNLKSINSDNVYLVDGMDGAGKDRSVTYNQFKDVAADVLVRFKPSQQLNIVISSLTGGSGCVISSLIARELIRQGHNTVVVGVDSSGSLVEIRNSVKTLKTLESFSKQLGAPIPLYYINRDSRTEADKTALRFINLLALLVDKNRTAEFDNSDLSTFLYFDRVTDNQPSVSMLDVMLNEEVVPEKNTLVVTSILMTKTPESALKPVVPENKAICVITDNTGAFEEVRINSLLGKLALVVAELESQIKSLEDTKRVNRVSELVVNANTDDGMVL